MNLETYDLKTVKCPKCGKSHFIKTGYGDGRGGFYDLLHDYGISDCVYRSKPTPVYKDGELENPEAFTPETTRDYYKCVECECNFYVETKWSYVGGDVNYAPTYTLVDKDKEDEEAKIAWAKKIEEQNKHIEEARKQREAENITGTVTVSSSGDLQYVTVKDNNKFDCVTINPPITVKSYMQYLGDGDKSTIDIGGTIFKTNVTYTDEQIKNIKDYFGWEAKNNE